MKAPQALANLGAMLLSSCQYHMNWQGIKNELYEVADILAELVKTLGIS